MPRTVVHLVHGTWPHGLLAQRLSMLQCPSHTWFDPASPFSRALAAALPADVELRPFLWSGANSYLARYAAAEALADQMRALHAAPDPPRQVLVGHSHGGNVAMLAAVHPLCPPLAGIATLGTPFLSVEHVLTDRDQQRLVIALQTITMLLAGVMLLVALFVAFGHADALSYAKSDWRTALQMFRIHPVFSAFILLVLYGLGTMLQRALWLRRVIGELPLTAAAPLAPLLVLRAPRDEASLVLAAAALAHLLLGIVWRPLRAALTRLGTYVRHSWFLPLLFLPLGWVSSTLPALARMLALGESWAVAWQQVYPVAAPATWPAWQRIPYELTRPVAEAGAPFALAVLLVVLVVGVLLFTAGALLAPFGWELIVMGLVLDVTAEASPPEVVYTGAMLPPQSHGLRHSVHELPEARSRLAAWIIQLPSPDPDARLWRIVTG